MLLERDLSEGVEVIVITFWQSLESIRGFAGADLERAVVSNEAAAILSRFDDRVRHYELVLKDGQPRT
jgi:heme-degrading monooxygenase HmoA